MPHYQPSHMITVGPMPAGATTGIQFAADRMPPLILQPDAASNPDPDPDPDRNPNPNPKP